MLLQKTPGKIYTFTNDPKEFYFLMWNFDIDSHVLKEEHKNHLKKTVVPYLDYVTLLGWPVQVKLFGHASATGSKSHNLALSGRRIGSVKQFLNANGNFGSTVKYVEKPLGERDRISQMIARMMKSSIKPDEEEAVDRAVRLQVIRWRLIATTRPKITDANWAEAFTRIRKAIQSSAAISEAIPDWIKIVSGYHQWNISPPHRESQKKVEQRLKDGVAIRVCRETHKVLRRYGYNVTYDEVVRQYLKWSKK